MGFNIISRKVMCHPRAIILLVAPVLCLAASTGFAAAMDHSFLQEFNGAQTCEMCHAGKVAEVQETVHYKFESDVPEDYLYDEEGHPRTIQKSGKLWKLCGYPTAIPQSNWLGKLADDPATPHIDKPGGCAKCHIGMGVKPYNARGFDAPQEDEANNVDCLVCHADNYSRKFYVAKLNGEPETVNGATVVMAAPKVDGVLDFSSQLEAARTVGLPKAEYCSRCHTAAGGGRSKLDDHDYSFKRGSIFDPEYDVHAAAGMSCISCHSAGNHKTKRSLNNDLYAYDTPVRHQLCLDCHSDDPHESDAMYNLHTSFVSCTTCHTTSQGGVVHKDFANVVEKDPDNPLSLYGLKQENAGPNFKLDYLWFNGTVQGEIVPAGSRGNGKIFPYKTAAFNQPVDVDGNPVPVKWGIFFKTGNLTNATATGLSLYTSFHTPELEETAGIPPVMGEFDHFAEHTALFSMSHSITKTDALRCADCHGADSVLDFDVLGYSPERAEQLMTLDVPGGGTSVNTWKQHD